MGRHKVKIERVCPKRDKHAICPEGYSNRHDWAKTMNKTHKQIKCDGCGLFAIWVEK